MIPRTRFLSASLLSLAPVAALAGSLDEPAAEAPAGVASAPSMQLNWSGAYAGLSLGAVSGDIDFFNPDFARDLDSGTLAGIYGGYQVQRGNFVYGGEFALSKPNDTPVTGFEGTSEIVDPMADLKGRVGYASGKFLFYGVLGYSFGTYSNVLGDPAADWDIDGFNYGVGVDYAINDDWLVGAEYLVRDLEGSEPGGGGQTVDVDFDSISIRFSYRF